MKLFQENIRVNFQPLQGYKPEFIDHRQSFQFSDDGNLIPESEYCYLYVS